MRLRIGQVRKRRHGRTEGGARDCDDGEVGLGDGSLLDRRRRDAGEIDMREVAAGFVPWPRSSACSALRQASVTSCPWSRRTTAKAVPHDPPPITVTRTAYSLLTKSIDTGTPSSSNRLRSSFSTQ